MDVWRRQACSTVEDYATDGAIDGVPITNEAGRLLGFVSRGDILRAVVTDPPLSLWR